MWLPVSRDLPGHGGTDDTETPPVPQAGELDQWSQQSYTLDMTAALDVGLALGSVSGKGEHRVFVLEEARFKEVATAHRRYRYGVSLRLIVQATDMEATGSVSFPMIAAKSQLGETSARCNLQIRGYRGSKLGALLPPLDDFNVATYTKYVESVGKIQDLVNSDEQNISPVLLAEYVAPTEKPDDTYIAVGRVWGLAELAQGKTLAQARDDFPGDHEAITGVEQVYAEVLGGGDDEEPTAQQRHMAEERLGGVSVRTRHLFG